MKVRNGKIYQYAPVTIVEDEEANKTVKYGDLTDFNAYIYPASGQVQSQIWGKELPYVFNLLTNEDVLKEGYGVAFNSATINYEVVSIKPYTEHFLCEIKRL